MAHFLTHAIRRASRCLVLGAAIAGTVGMLAVAGCSDTGGISTMKSLPPPSPGPMTAEQKQIALTFDVSKCEQMQPGLYKCPAIDKPICDPNFNNPSLTCLRIGHKGSVFVQTSPGPE